MHIETNTKRTKNLVLLTTLDFMKSFWNHNNPTLDFIYPLLIIIFAISRRSVLLLVYQSNNLLS